MNGQPSGDPLDLRAVVPLAPTERLTPENHSLCAGFTCARPGQAEERWERDVSDWITSTEAGGVLDAITQTPPTEVYLYRDGEGCLIGFVAIGTAELSLPNDRTQTVWALPYLGIHSNFRGQKCPREQRYGVRMLRWLVDEIDRRGRHSLLMLYVDPLNPAKTLYEAAGFVVFDQVEYGERPWLVMLRRVAP